MSKKRRKFTDEFKAEVIGLIQSGKSIASTARDLGLSESVVHRWIQQAKVADAPVIVTPAGALSANEREELARLRKENSRLKMEREILKKAAAFFANESK